MTHLADDATAALDRVLQPVRARQPPGVDPVADGERRLPAREELARRRASGENLRLKPKSGGPRNFGHFEHALQLLVAQRERLFHEDVLARFERAAGQLRVQVVARGDDDQIYLRVAQDFVRTEEQYSKPYFSAISRA